MRPGRPGAVVNCSNEGRGTETTGLKAPVVVSVEPFSWFRFRFRPSNSLVSDGFALTTKPPFRRGFALTTKCGNPNKIAGFGAVSVWFRCGFAK